MNRRLDAAAAVFAFAGAATGLRVNRRLEGLSGSFAMEGSAALLLYGAGGVADIFVTIRLLRRDVAATLRPGVSVSLRGAAACMIKEDSDD